MGRGKFNDEEKMALAGCYCCVFIISVILFACSWSILTPHQMGLHYNAVRLRLHDKPEDVRDSGRYLLGLGHRFIKYPRKMIYLEFSNLDEGGGSNKPLMCWSRDGQEIEIEVGFYYRIKHDELPDLYYKLKENYTLVIERVAMESIKDVSTRFNTIQFFTQRTLINDLMHEELDKRMQEFVHAEVPVFNLLGIDVPNAFEEAVINKVIQAQERITLGFQQLTAEIRANIRLLQKQAAKEIGIIRAQATAQGLITQEIARASAFIQLRNASALAYTELVGDLSFNKTQFLQYLWYGAIKNQPKDAKLVLGFPSSPILNLG